MATQYDLQAELLLEACRLPAVASIAGIAPLDWASVVSPRVIIGNADGYVQGLHRGRLPFIEIYQTPQLWERQTSGGGSTLTTWSFRAHVVGPTMQLAQSKAQELAQVCVTAIRSLDYFLQGGFAVSELKQSPIGFALEFSIEINQTYCKSDFGTGIIVNPGSPIVIIPGTDAGFAGIVGPVGLSGGMLVTTNPAGLLVPADPTNPTHNGQAVGMLPSAAGPGSVAFAIVVGEITQPWAWVAGTTLYLGAGGQPVPLAGIPGGAIFQLTIGSAIDSSTIELNISTLSVTL